MVACPRQPFTVPLPGRAPLALGDRTLVMGVLNVTPDSFSDGGTAFGPDAAVDRARAIEADGADIIDIGAESTRPGAEALDDDEEWRRLRPILKGLAVEDRDPDLRRHLPVGDGATRARRRRGDHQ